MTQITLSSGETVEVEPLYPFEDDGLKDEYLGEFDKPFCYPAQVGIDKDGQPKYKDVPYPLSKLTLDEAPLKPDMPERECVQGSAEWYAWRDYNIYQAAIAHREKEMRASEDYARAKRRQIVGRIAETDRGKITPDTFNEVAAAVLIPGLTLEDVAAEWRRSFPG